MARRRERSQLNLAALAAVAALAAAVMHGTHGWQREWTMDDRYALLRNGCVTGRLPWRELLQRDYWGTPLLSAASHKSFRPLTTATFRLQAALHGLSDAAPFHGVNVALHVVNAVLLAAFVRGLPHRRPAALAALAAAFFLLQPAASEAIVNVTGRAELLAALCTLATMLLVASASSSRPLPLAAAALTSVAGLAAKETAIVALPLAAVPALHALVLRGKGKTAKRKALRRRGARFHCCVVAMAVVGGGLLAAARLRLQRGRLPQFSAADNPIAALRSWQHRALTFGYTNARTLSLLLLPTPLCADYSGRAIGAVKTLSDTRNLLTAVVAVAVCAIVARAVTPRRSHVLAVAAALLFAPLLPACHLFITVGFVIAERTLYLPSAGAALLASHFTLRVASTLRRSCRHAPHALRSRRLLALTALLTAVCAAAACRSVQRSWDWQSNLRLWSAAAESCPINSKLLNNGGKALQRAHLRNSAADAFAAALQLDPHSAHAAFNLGMLAQQAGRADDALRWYALCLRMQPAYASAWNNAAVALAAAHRHREAAAAMQRYARLKPEADVQAQLVSLRAAAERAAAAGGG